MLKLFTSKLISHRRHSKLILNTQKVGLVAVMKKWVMGTVEMLVCSSVAVVNLLQEGHVKTLSRI